MEGGGGYRTNNLKERRCGMGSYDGWGGMNGGDDGYDAVVMVCDVVRMGGRLQGQAVSYDDGQVDNIDV